MTLWFRDEAIAGWRAAPWTTRGGQAWYSPLAILTALTLKAVFRLALGQIEGLIGSIIDLLGLSLAVPTFSTLSRRVETVDVPRSRCRTSGFGDRDGYRWLSPRATAADLAGMDRQTLRDWVHRFNAAGLEGVSDRPRPGRPTFLSAEQMNEVQAWVEAGPDLKTDGVVRWRRIDLVERIKATFSLTLDVHTVGRLLRRLDFRRLSVLPQHPESDDAAQETFKRDFPELAAAAIREPARGKPVEIWWQDEARVGQQGTLTRIWAKCGTRPRAVRDHRFTSAYVFGAVCPERGTGAAMIMPNTNIEAMNLHLAEISCCVSPGSIALLMLDRAGWHRSPKLKIPDNIALLPLPPYAPN